MSSLRSVSAQRSSPPLLWRPKPPRQIPARTAGPSGTPCTTCPLVSARPASTQTAAITCALPSGRTVKDRGRAGTTRLPLRWPDSPHSARPCPECRLRRQHHNRALGAQPCRERKAHCPDLKSHVSLRCQTKQDVRRAARWASASTASSAWSAATAGRSWCASTARKWCSERNSTPKRLCSSTSRGRGITHDRRLARQAP